jgi:hypothetical protein
MARDMGFEVDMVTEFAKGGKTYNRSWHQDHYNVNKEESWERQDGVRHGKTARNRYAKGGNVGKINTYKLRAEGLDDFLAFLRTGMYSKIKSFTIEPIGVPDVVVTFETKSSLSEVKSKLKEVRDSHVMLETIKPISEYTGEREDEYAKGGKLKSYKYVPNRNIESVTLTQGEGTITIPQDNILDGVYIRKRYKAFGRGGNTGNYNEGLSWKLDRERFAKKQAYEVQYRKHK